MKCGICKRIIDWSEAILVGGIVEQLTKSQFVCPDCKKLLDAERIEFKVRER